MRMYQSRPFCSIQPTLMRLDHNLEGHTRNIETLDAMDGKAARGSPRDSRAGTLSKVIARWCAHAELTRAFGTVNCTIRKP